MADAGSSKTALLTYNAASEFLSGSLSGKQFSIHAFSGGSRGHVKSSATIAARYLHDQADKLSSHYANTPEIRDVRGNYVQRGGTLPAGHYNCHFQATSSVGTDVIRLYAQPDALAIYSPFSAHAIPHGTYSKLHHGYEPRNGFYIHGAGNKGSDGCIVIPGKKDRLELSYAIRDYPGQVVLLVKNVSYILPAELGGSAFA